MKVILDSFVNKSKLVTNDTVIMSMAFVSSRWNAEQTIVTQNGRHVQQASVLVSAQYKIENALVDINAL